MRILGFSKKWDKLNRLEFTTFRFARNDKDWQINEQVKIKIKPRSKGGGTLLGIAKIINKETRRIDHFRASPSIPYSGFVTEEEAMTDGFVNAKEMLDWLDKSYHYDDRWVFGEPMNKLTLQWIQRVGKMDTESRKMDKPTISVIICTRNEADNLPAVLPHIPKWVNEVVLVDNGSTDNTVEVARKLYPKIKVAYQWREGKGDTLKLGILKAEGGIVVTLDGDGANDPSEMMDFIKPLLRGYDFAKGTRFLHGFPKHKRRHRAFGNWVIVTLFNILFRKKYTDLCSGYNAFWRKRTLTTLSPWTKDSFENEPFINSRIARKGLKVIEVPHTELPRKHGEIKESSWRQGFKAVKSIIRERLR